jgi:hypothetical protein
MKILDTIQSKYTGWYSLPFFGKYIQFPKLAPYFTVAMLIFAFGDMWNILPMFVVGSIMVAFCVFCFMLLRIFPKRKYNGLTRVN